MPKDGIVGPVPEGADAEEYDKLRRRVLWKMPSGLYVIGSRAGERRNGMTLELGVAARRSTQARRHRASNRPRSRTSSSPKGGVFSVCIIDREDRAIVRKFTKPVEVDIEARTLNGFPYHDGVTGAPILDQAVAYLDCEVRQAVDLGEHTLFVGEIVDAAFQRDDEETPVLRMEDTADELRRLARRSSTS